MHSDRAGAVRRAAERLLKHRTRFRRRRFFPLPIKIRIAVFLIGWLLILVGILGLVLPGIQGILTLAIGAALLSLASEVVYERMRRSFHRWPQTWRKLEGVRFRLLRWLRRKRR